MGDFDSLYLSLDSDARRRGEQFERVCKWFFENDPVYSRELKKVWLWKDWPGRWGSDAGIDLVAENRNGELWAIQAKAYDPKYRVSKTDVDKFLAESGRKVFAYRILIATTDRIDRTGERTIQQQEKRSSFFRLNDLRAAALDWPASPAQLRPAKRRKPARPRPHQAEAIRDVVKGFKTSDRGQVIMACGTGKTLTGLFIAEKLKCHRTLVLLPSLSLLKQTLNEWRANCTEDFASLPVCSDDTVVTTDDTAVAHASDLGVPVTTDPRAIAAFLRRRSGPLVVFSTYQSSPQIEAAFKLGHVPRFDLILADEAHRVAGPVSSDFATALDSRAIKSNRRLFMTATPRYFTGRVLKAAQEADFEVASMDDAVKFGPVFHRLSFGEAIERDLLTDYQVAVVGVDDATYREWAKRGTLVTRDGKQVDSAATLAGQIGLAKAMRKYDLRRVISFHSRVKRAREFATSMPEVIEWMPARQRPKGALWADVATGEMPAGDRYVLLQHLARLDDGEPGLLANARCLSEGVDVPTLDGVAFVDPRRSEVDIVQAVGRAIRKSDAKSVGTIVIPVFIDTDEDPEVALDSSVFKPVWDVIQALRAHDEELGEQLDGLRRQMGRKGGKSKLPDKIHLDVPATVGRDFAAAFDVRLVERSTTTWEFWYGLLERYVAENGTSLLHKDAVVGGHRLGGWCATQRARGRSGALDRDQFQRLDQLPDWMWERNEGRWEIGYQQMKAFSQEHGHALINSTETYNGYPLGAWAALQRRDGRTGSLSVERRKKLESLAGWVWEVVDLRWDEAVKRLLDYVDEYGDSLVPQPYTSPDGFRLGAWVNFQRARQRQGKLESDRADRLAPLPGWVWTARDAKWQSAFQILKRFAEEHGNVVVPISHPVDDGGIDLRAWFANQRAKFDRLSPARQQLLRSLPGWDQASHDGRWELGFKLLRRHLADTGTAKVERSCVIDGFPLGTWAMTRRLEYKRGELDSDRVKLLSALPGWDWDRRGGKWEDGFIRLQNYLEAHGRMPPLDYVEDNGYRLGAWAQQQRHLRKKGTLAVERISRLDAIDGWKWDPRAEQWDEGFTRLERYVRANGHVPPAKHVDEDGYRLGSWLARQRSLHRHGELEPASLSRLDQLTGCKWKSPRSASRRP